MAKHGSAVLAICSGEFVALGHAQARALGYPDLPIVTIPHPFGALTREEVRQLAERCVDDVVRAVSLSAREAVQP